jgi:hypothetical protein
MGSLNRRRLERLEARTEPELDPAVRERMKELLDELAAARREGRPPSREAREVSEYFRRRQSERGD